MGENRYDEFELVIVTDVGDYGGGQLCEVGEYLLLDEDGRDVLGPRNMLGMGRNPGKWDIDYEVVASLGDLVSAADRTLIEEAGDE